MTEPEPEKGKGCTQVVEANGAATVVTVSPDYHEPAPEGHSPRHVRRREARERRQQVRQLPLEEWRKHLDQGVQSLFHAAGLDALQQMLEEDADDLCGGPKGRHLKSERAANRHGTERTWLPIGSRRVPFRRPRVRSAQGELVLPTYQAALQGLFTQEAVTVACLAGVSQRAYPEVASFLEGTPLGLPARELSRSSVGRRFVQETRQSLEALQQRHIDGKRVLALYLDAKAFQGRALLVALGLLEDGSKQILGLREGSSENTAVVSALLEDLVSRGLSVERGLLVVLDGGKALAAGVRAVLGARALIQRCQVHKKRNVLEHLPQREREIVSKRLSQIWACPVPQMARRSLESLARELERGGYREAAASLREGLTETLTCHHLGLEPALALTQSLATTNPIESAFSRVERISGHVTNWQSGEMVLRWTAAGLLKAEEGFQLVGTPETLKRLADALDQHARRVRRQPTAEPLHRAS